MINKYVEWAIDINPDEKSLTKIMRHANHLAESMRDTPAYAEYEIRFNQIMEESGLTPRELNLLRIQQDYCTAYQALFTSAMCLGEDLNPYYEELVMSVYKALVAEGKGHFLTDGLSQTVFDKYLGKEDGTAI